MVDLALQHFLPLNGDLSLLLKVLDHFICSLVVRFGPLPLLLFDDSFVLLLSTVY